jgi:hypothetical protein
MKIAQTQDSPFKGIDVPSSGGKIDVNSTNIGDIITQILPYIFGAAGILLLIYLVTAGLSMMLSRGDPKAMQTAQSKITNALIGFVIVFFAFALVSIIGRILGISVFGNIFG